MKKLKFLTVVVLLLFVSLTCSAKYIVHSISGDVAIRRSGVTAPVQLNQELRANDEIIIPENAKIDILNDANSLIFSSTQSGEFTVTQIIVNAKLQAENHQGNIVSKMYVNNTSQNEGSVYVESGKVTRKQGDYNAAEDTMMMDIKLLSNYIADVVRNIEDASESYIEYPMELSIIISSDGQPKGYEIFNTLDSPIYFNVIKLAGNGENRISVSELGQPKGSYILLPEQSMTRRQLNNLDAFERHILVLANNYFDIEDLILNVDDILKTNSPVLSLNIDNVPIFIKVL